MEAGLSRVSVDVWLSVVPQLIARLHMRRHRARTAHQPTRPPHAAGVGAAQPDPNGLMRRLLSSVGAAHPQALIYPLTVACNSSGRRRRATAGAIIEHMRRDGGSAVLVDQAAVVATELTRVALLWPDVWSGSIEEASRLFFTENDPDGARLAVRAAVWPCVAWRTCVCACMRAAVRPSFKFSP